MHRERKSVEKPTEEDEEKGETKMDMQKGRSPLEERRVRRGEPERFFHGSTIAHKEERYHSHSYLIE